ncbi:MAG: hypothetical protein M1820_003042 [Bogoriella megaspora]|nr:MAG: hypothetical protein M1820_003042 [Bogoriella megaspora]
MNGAYYGLHGLRPVAPVGGRWPQQRWLDIDYPPAPPPYLHARWRVDPSPAEMNAMRIGVQVHAVPENERAFDSKGNRMPWGYEYADSPRREPLERGPFGKTSSLRNSRSRTFTPARSKEEQAKLENLRAEDEMINAFKAQTRQRAAAKANKTSMTSMTTMSSVEEKSDALKAASAPAKEPAEVMIYGFGSDSQWAALAFYERASRGAIYEDYDRQPPNPKYPRHFSNAENFASASLGKLSGDALRRKNTYIGGDHWIKVTFDCAESADNAIRFSPHNVCGYLVHAERYRGVGPNVDAPIFPNYAENTYSSTASPPTSQSTQTLSGGSPDSSSTATITGDANTTPVRRSDSNSIRRRHPLAQTTNADDQQQQQQQQSTPSRPRIEPVTFDLNTTAPRTPAAAAPQTPGIRYSTKVPGARLVTLAPASSALLPTPPAWKVFLASLPFLGALFSLLLGVQADGEPTPEGGWDMIGNGVPRMANGEMDWERTGVYWRVMWWVDRITGGDVCGLREED